MHTLTARNIMPEMAREYTRVGGQMETAKSKEPLDSTPRWCSPDECRQGLQGDGAAATGCAGML